MDLGLSGKTAIVTGGSRGIGKAIARQLSLENVDVAIVARDSVALRDAAIELTGQTDRRVLAISADTGNDASVRQMVKEAVDAFGHVDILVNCAAKAGGQSAPPILADVTDDLFWDDVNVKVMGYLRCAREVAPYMVHEGWGRIISLSGLAARRAGSIVGGMRNVAVVAMTKNLAEELGPNGINVTVVHPGRVRTEAVEALMLEQARQQGVSVDEIAQRMAQGNAIRRVLNPDDIANVVTFLASPKSVAINGDVIAAGGGVGKGIYY